MCIKPVSEVCLDLYFEYFKVSADISKEKIAFGQQRCIWIRRSSSNHAVPAAIPTEILFNVPKKKKKSMLSRLRWI